MVKNLCLNFWLYRNADWNTRSLRAKWLVNQAFCNFVCGYTGAKHLLILNLNAVLYSGQQMLRPYNNIEFPKHRVKPGTDKSVPTIFVIGFVGTVLTVPAQNQLK